MKNKLIMMHSLFALEKWLEAPGRLNSDGLANIVLYDRF